MIYLSEVFHFGSFFLFLLLVFSFLDFVELIIHDIVREVVSIHFIETKDGFNLRLVEDSIVSSASHSEVSVFQCFVAILHFLYLFLFLQALFLQLNYLTLIILFTILIISILFTL